MKEISLLKMIFIKMEYLNLLLYLLIMKQENNAYIQFLNDDYTYQFDTNKIHYKNYDQAIKSFKKKGNTYTNKDYQIVVTKNKIITTYRGSR